MAIDYDRAADLLLAARRNAHPIDNLPPECQPATIEDAYAIQDRIITALGPIGGWKVGELSKGGPIACAPLHKANIRHSGTKLEIGALNDAGIEIEFAFRMERDFPAMAQAYDRETILAGVSLCPLLEIIATRFVNKGAVGMIDRLADTQSNGYMVVGAPIHDWRGIDLTRHEAELMIDGAQRQTSTTISPAGDPIELLVWQVNHCAGRGGMKTGDVITTGALAGATTIVPGNIAEADFGQLGRVSVSFI
ncbi:MAG TPA: fumarylacetoacetate hydrolase family protein [Stellaceae bacterium]|nr:fumarylacetoacetate hydrolase family protein [Stellaceae bacterium]